MPSSAVSIVFNRIARYEEMNGRTIKFFNTVDIIPLCSCSVVVYIG